GLDVLDAGEPARAADDEPQVLVPEPRLRHLGAGEAAAGGEGEQLAVHAATCPSRERRRCGWARRNSIRARIASREGPVGVQAASTASSTLEPSQPKRV